MTGPGTGEMVTADGLPLTLDSPSADLARGIAELDEHLAQVTDLKNELRQELLRRLDQNAKWVAHVPGFKITGDTPKETETWDGADLYSRLSDLAEAGTISIEAVNAAVSVETVYKAKKAGLNALRALGGDAAVVVDELAVKVPKGNRSVRVERAA
jgi:hypothetical protein